MRHIKIGTASLLIALVGVATMPMLVQAHATESHVSATSDYSTPEQDYYRLKSEASRSLMDKYPIPITVAALVSIGGLSFLVYRLSRKI